MTRLKLINSTFVCILLFPSSAPAQIIYSWNNSGTAWTTAGNWTPAGPPGLGDVAQFEVLGSFYPAAIQQPVLNSAASVLQARWSNTAQFTGWTLTGTGALTAGGTSANDFGLLTQGTGMTTINLGNGVTPSLLLSGPTGATGGAIVVGSGSQLILSGQTVATVAGTAPISIRGGTLVLDNSDGNPALQRLTTANAIQLYGGGATLEFRGAADGSIFSGLTGTLTAAGAGTTYLRTAASSGSPLSVNFATLNRASNTGVHVFENIGSGFVGQSSSPQILFTTAPATYQGIISASASSAVPWVVVSQRSSVSSGDVTARWANYNPTAGVVAASTTSYTGNFGSAAIGTNVLFVGPSQANQTVNLTGSNALASVVLEPQADGTTLSISSGGQINTLGILLSGTRDLTITGGSLFSTSTSGPRILFVANPTTRLFTSSNLAASNNPLIIGGPGTVVLTGSSNQISFSLPQNVVLGGGTLRVNPTNFNPSTAIVCFRGGVLEYDVSDGNYNFNLTLGATGGNRINWTTSTDFGSGGFAAYSSTAGRRLFVNLLDNAGNTATLTWGSGNFVADGYALQFGSASSNALVAWQNPIRLDSLTPGRYLVREIRVTQGSGTADDRTVLVGVVSGSPTTDLLKSGNGTLELAGLNTYRGNTLIQEGTLIVADNASIGTAASRSGHIIVGSGARLAGTGTLYPDDTTSKQVIVQPGGAIRGGHPKETSFGTGVLTIYGPLALRSSATQSATLQTEVRRTGSNTVNASRIDVGAPFNIELDLGSGKLAIELINPSGAPSLLSNETYTFTLMTTNGDGRFRLNGTVLTNNTIIDPAYYEIRPAFLVSGFTPTLRIVDNGINGGSAMVLTLVPVPEPSAVLGVAAVVAAGSWFLRRRMQLEP